MTEHFLRFEHEVRDGLNTYTARAGRFTAWGQHPHRPDPTATSTVDRVAAHHTTAYRRYLDGIPAMRTLADFHAAATQLLADGRGR
ncbi:hypothetical protein ACFPIJ_08580 [Dactylosporangium cerinum]|uniref:Uncharacterized protein n=1 Tax=Dactylosporangium cerinum TaxID=1434730 RepID=A0ABV9VNH0_9ACTN